MKFAALEAAGVKTVRSLADIGEALKSIIVVVLLCSPYGAALKYKKCPFRHGWRCKAAFYCLRLATRVNL